MEEGDCDRSDSKREKGWIGGDRLFFSLLLFSHYHQFSTAAAAHFFLWRAEKRNSGGRPSTYLFLLFLPTFPFAIYGGGGREKFPSSDSRPTSSLPPSFSANKVGKNRPHLESTKKLLLLPFYIESFLGERRRERGLIESGG